MCKIISTCYWTKASPGQWPMTSRLLGLQTVASAQVELGTQPPTSLELRSSCLFQTVWVLNVDVPLSGGRKRTICMLEAKPRSTAKATLNTEPSLQPQSSLGLADGVSGSQQWTANSGRLIKGKTEEGMGEGEREGTHRKERSLWAVRD